MLWIIDGLIYGFFTALYTLVNQHYKFNGYLLGIWRGFGISFFFLPFLFFLPNHSARLGVTGVISQIHIWQISYEVRLR